MPHAAEPVPIVVVAEQAPVNAGGHYYICDVPSTVSRQVKAVSLKSSRISGADRITVISNQHAECEK